MNQQPNSDLFPEPRSPFKASTDRDSGVGSSVGNEPFSQRLVESINMVR